MVQTGVGFDPAKKDLTQIDYVIAGTCSSVATRFVAQPFDVLKIRFQLQVEPISVSNVTSKYTGISQAINKIIKEEGVYALWKGHLPGQVLSIVYGTAQFSSFELLTKITHKFFHGIEHNKIEKKSMHDLKHHTGLGHPEHHPKTYTKLHEPEDKIMEHLFCGSIAGCVGTFTSFPLDVVRTRLISQGNPKVYRSMYDAIAKIYKLEGVRGYYKGLTPSLIQIIPFSGLLFGFNRLFKQLWHKTAGHLDQPSSLADSYKNNMQAVLHVIESGLCGAASGFAAKSIVYPLDLLKKRLQVQGFGYARKEFGAHHDYRSLFDGIKQIYKTESFSGFYKGFFPSVLKSGFSTAMQFIVYEEIIRFLIKRRKKKCD